MQKAGPKSLGERLGELDILVHYGFCKIMLLSESPKHGLCLCKGGRAEDVMGHCDSFLSFMWHIQDSPDDQDFNGTKVWL